MAASEQLCQPADVLGFWPGFGNLSAYEQASLLNVASQKVVNFCRRGFGQALVTETKSGKNRPRLWLDLKPVISVVSVTVNGFALDNTFNNAWYFKPATGELGRGNGQDDLRFATWFPAGSNNVIVQYWAGYASVPDPIIRATAWAVKWLHAQGKVTGIYSSESIGDYSYSLNPEALSMTLPAHIASLCADYVFDDGPT